MSKARLLADFISTGVGTGILADGAIDSTEITGVTVSSTEINRLAGVTSDVQTQINTKAATSSLAAVATSGAYADVTGTPSLGTAAALNVGTAASNIPQLDGTGKLPAIDGSQLTGLGVTQGTLTKTFTQNETADITLSQGITSAPVVSATKEVPQTGVSTKGNWDVNSTASNYDFHNTAANVTLTPTSVSNFATTSGPFAALSGAYSASGHISNYSQCFQFVDSGNKGIFADHNSEYVFMINFSTAYDVTTASFTTGRTQFYYATHTGNVHSGAVTMSSDGTKMYIMTGTGSTTYIYQFSFATAFDFSSHNGTSSWAANTHSPIPASANSIVWKSNGTKFYITDYNSAIFEYSVSTAWDVTSGTTLITSQSFSAEAGSTGVRDVTFTSDGSKMYILSDGNNFIYEYSLSSPWLTSTKSYTNNSFDYSSLTTNVPDIELVNDSFFVFLDNATFKLSRLNLGSSTSLALGSGSFASTDVGKRIVGNGGDVILTSTGGAFSTTGGSAFTDSSTIAAGSWSMFGLKSAGDADGITMSAFSTTGTNFNTSPPLLSRTPSSLETTYFTNFVDCCVSKNGLYLYGINMASNATLNQFTMSTAYDLSTATYTRNIATGVNSGGRTGVSINNDGSKMYVTYNQSGTEYLKTYALSTAYDISTAVNTNNNSIPVGSGGGGSNNYGGGFSWSADGTKAYFYPYNNWTGNSTVGHTSGSTDNRSGVMYQYNVSTAFDWAGSSPSVNATIRVPHKGDNYGVALVTSDGKWLINHQYNQKYLYYYPLTTPYDISTQVVASEGRIDTSPYNSSGGINQGGIGGDHVNGIFFNASYNHKRVDANNYGTENLFSIPTGSYNVAVTNTSGRIDSSAFTDINSMTAAQAAGTGTVHYAVSTDGRTTWSVAKGTSGVRPIVRNNSGTWQYNNDAGTVNGYDISSPTYLSNTGTVVSGSGSDPTGITFKPDGTKMYVCQNDGNRVNDYVLSTAWDVSTAASDTHGGILGVGSQDSVPTGVQLKSDGTKAYVLGGANSTLYQYTLSNAWDVFPSSYDSVSFSFASQDTNCADFFFKPDGTQLFLAGEVNDKIFAYSLSTAWDLSTMSYSNVSLDISSYETGVKGVTFSADGTKVFTVGPAYVRYWTLSTAWDLSTASYSGTYNSSGQGTNHEAIAFKDDGTKMYIVIADAGNWTQGNQKVNQYTTGGIGYGTSTTWVDGTTNDELYTLQEALGAQAFNRMDKTQLDAIPDANHFSTGSSLDLMIALRMDTAAATLPTSDGVTLNYDAAALNEGAVLGTDYDFFFPANNKVQIKSLAAQNLKVRVV